MFGITEFSAVINPPQAAIMAVGGGRSIAVPVEATGNDIFGPGYDITNVMSVKVTFSPRSSLSPPPPPPPCSMLQNALARA